jgi:hypothetical protein
MTLSQNSVYISMEGLRLGEGLYSISVQNVSCSDAMMTRLAKSNAS